MGPKIERISDSLVIGEAPHWDVVSQSLYYVDVFGKSIHRYCPTTNKHYKATIGTSTVSFIIPVEGSSDEFVIGLGSELVMVTWDGTSDKVSKIEKLVKPNVKAGIHENRFNDGKADPSGRLWTGTMGLENADLKVASKQGFLCSLEKDRKLKIHFEDVHISNGLAWNTERGKFYFIDSGEGKVEQFDFDINLGTISNRQTVFTLSKHNISGAPDGQAIDNDGNLWVAIFNGQRIIKIDPNKPETLLQTIDMPAKQVTSVAFGGVNLDELYVTTACLDALNDGIKLQQPENGAMYRITGLGVRGLPGMNIKL